MSCMQPHLTLRQMQPEDGPAIAALREQTPDTGAVGFHLRFRHDVYATLLALRPNTIGVVAEVPDYDGIVGTGLLSFGDCYYEGVVRPFAYLNSLRVHPNYRRRGIASRIAAWRVDTARAWIGNEGVIFAGIQQGNEGSLRTAAKWSTQRLDGRTTVGVVKVRTMPPKHRSDLDVRPALMTEWEEIAEKQNTFYHDYNLYPPQTAQALDAWRAQSPFGFQLHEYYVVVDSNRNILAGLGITEEGKLVTLHVARMALLLRVANVVFKMIPADGVVKRLPISYFWFAPGRVEAGAYLWELLRWLWRGRGTLLMVFFDPHSPLTKAIRLPKLIPKTKGSIVLNGPVPMREDRCIYQHI
jgi:GNAT superfamily N-acetyltransferase